MMYVYTQLMSRPQQWIVILGELETTDANQWEIARLYVRSLLGAEWYDDNDHH